MRVRTRLTERRDQIHSRWFHRILDKYSPDSTELLSRTKDQFRNPVGHTLFEGTGKIIDELLSDMDHQELSRTLDNVIRVRSVQDFTASEAVGFVFELKAVIREELTGWKDDPAAVDELLELDSRVDRVAVLAFEVYTQCREKLYQIRADEARKRSHLLLDKINRIEGIRSHEGDRKNDGNI